MCHQVRLLGEAFSTLVALVLLGGTVLLFVSTEVAAVTKGGRTNITCEVACLYVVSYVCSQLIKHCEDLFALIALKRSVISGRVTHHTTPCSRGGCGGCSS